MKVKDIVQDWLKKHKCDGLSNSHTECGCGFDDFMPCGEWSGDCEAARSEQQPDGSEYDFLMYPADIESEEAEEEKELAIYKRALTILARGRSTQELSGKTRVVRRAWHALEIAREESKTEGDGEDGTE